MNSPFIHGKKAVLAEWKRLRSALSEELTDRQHVEMVMRFWNLAPMSTRFMDWDQPSLWPDPWEMINANEYDDSMVSLGMFYTLLLSRDQRWSPDRLELMLVRDQELCIQRMVLGVDRQWLMNLEYDRLVSTGGQVGRACTVQQRYRYDGKRHLIADDFSLRDAVITSDNRHHALLNIESS